ncbi:MAG: hypothetical protein FWF31_04565 [Desulfobulbus sp.]|nr:hypothetical protein [Desulfobulbus sp.]
MTVALQMTAWALYEHGRYFAREKFGVFGRWLGLATANRQSLRFLRFDML